MNDHNLDDLIIGEPESGGKGPKSLLTLIGLILIILIVGVFLAKLIFSEPETTSEEATTELTGVVKPAGQGTTAEAKGPKAQPAEEIPDELKPIAKETLPESGELSPIAPSASPSAKAKTSRPTPPKAEAARPVTKPKPKPVAAKKPAPAPKPKPKVKKPSPSELFAKQKAKTKSKAEQPAGKKIYYIQIGSFKRMPNQKYLDKIKAKGYKPVIVKSGEMVKVRVGPYGSYADAKARLPEVKEKLGISGFVVRKQ